MIIHYTIYIFIYIMSNNVLIYKQIMFVFLNEQYSARKQENKLMRATSNGGFIFICGDRNHDLGCSFYSSKLVYSLLSWEVLFFILLYLRILVRGTHFTYNMLVAAIRRYTIYNYLLIKILDNNIITIYMIKIQNNNN